MIARSRRTSAEWALPRKETKPVIDVLIPTCGRVSELAVTLAALAAQDDPAFRVIISDQSEASEGLIDASVQAMIRVLEAQGRLVRVLHHLPRRGMAEQRQFLLEEASAELVLYLDDDVWLEPGMLARLGTALSELDCGFVGAAVQGLSYLADDRPGERERFELWYQGVHTERIRRGSASFERWPLHNAANLTHLAAELHLSQDEWLAYKIAWVGGCVLYRRSMLLACGGFDFWRDLPAAHAGEDVVAQWRVMERFGGAGILPTGAVHLEAPTTVTDRRIEASDVVFGAGLSADVEHAHLAG